MISGQKDVWESYIFIGVPARLAFIRTLSLSAAVRPPNGDDWLHEPKWDGLPLPGHQGGMSGRPARIAEVLEKADKGNRPAR